MAIFTIPLLTLAVGPRTFGPFTVGNNTRAEIDIRRDVANGLNSLTFGTTLQVTIQSSPDGTTWSDEVSSTINGGIITDRHGQIDTNVMVVQGLPTTTTKVRVLTVVAGPSSVAIAGSVTVT